MKITPRILLISMLALGLGAGSASATLFEFSYTFADGGVATLSLLGTPDGQFLDNISDVSVKLNGTAMPGTVYAATYDQSTASYLPGAVVSFNGALNDFFFANSDLASGDFSFDSLFYLTDAPDFAGLSTEAFSPGLIASQDSAINPNEWRLVATIPDGGATVALLGMAAIALAGLRRRFA